MVTFRGNDVRYARVSKTSGKLELHVGEELRNALDAGVQAE